MQVAAGAAFHTTSATDGRHDTVSRSQDYLPQEGVCRRTSGLQIYLAARDEQQQMVYHTLLLRHWYEIMAFYYVKSQLPDKIEGFCKKAKSS